MKEFILLFRSEPPTGEMPGPEQLAQISKPWLDWMGSLTDEGKLVDRGNRLSFEGTTVYPQNVTTDGPYAEIKEILLGYTIVKAETTAKAIELAKNCPILANGGNVEVRSFVQMQS